MKVTIPVVMYSILLLIMSCSDDNPTNQSPAATFSGYVLNSADSSGIKGASIVVWNVNTNAPVTRTFTDNTGYYIISVEPESYYVKASAQDFFPSPLKNGSALPFQLIANTVIQKDIYLRADSLSTGAGSISGTVMTLSPTNKGIGGVLIVATDTTEPQSSFSGTSGHDGFYVIFNITPGTYDMHCYRAGYRQITTSVKVKVSADSQNSSNNIVIQQNTNYSMDGQISFLATNNSQVDITLIHPTSREVIPGLSTFNETNGNTYSISQVPSGTYVAWASFRNDTYVMDPDALFKSGLPYVKLSASNPDTSINFNVTGALQIVSPTNHPDTILPRAVATFEPTFTWIKTPSYASAKEYIVEVCDSYGESIWGGFDSLGVIRHPRISSGDTMKVIFNFDSSASAPLHDKMVYQWKVFADNSAEPNVQTLLSVSEDLMGLFQVVIDE